MEFPIFPLKTLLTWYFVSSTKHWADGFKEIAAVSQGLTTEWLCSGQKPAFYVWIICHHVHLFIFIHITLHLVSYLLVIHFPKVLPNAALSTFVPTTLSSSASPVNLSNVLTFLTLWICDGVGPEVFGAGNFLGVLLLSFIQVLPAHRTIFSFKHTPYRKHMQILNPEISFKYFLAFLFPKWIRILASPCLFINTTFTLPRRQMLLPSQWCFVSSACVHFCVFSNVCVWKYWN